MPGSDSGKLYLRKSFLGGSVNLLPIFLVRVPFRVKIAGRYYLRLIPKKADSVLFRLNSRGEASSMRTLQQ